MNKRSFLKATGVTFVASLIAAPFLGRRDSIANAQESGDLAAQIEALRKDFQTQLQNETDERKADSAAIRRSLEASFIGTVTAIASNKIPYGWHLCDGTTIPDAPEYKRLKDLTGLTNFPDYRGVFLRGLDEKTQDGVGAARGFDPNRTLDGQVQDSANRTHSHPASSDTSGKHGHTIGDTTIGGFYNVTQRYRLRYDTFKDVATGAFGDVFVKHSHTCDEHMGHTHPIKVDASGDPKESRPKNVAVRYIIKYM